MVTRVFSMYSLADLGITAGNYNFSNLTSTGSFTASATAAATSVTLEDTDSQTNIFNDGAPGNFAAAPTSQLLTGTVDGTVFTNAPSNPENQFEVTDSNGTVVGFLYDLHNANSSAFASLQGYVTDFELIPGETYSVVRTTGLPSASYDDFITCFAAGTQVLTAQGNVAIQDLRVGDKVVTMDHGLQEIRWLGSRSVIGTGAFAPVRICQGALGNTQDLLVSPNHRMLISDWRAEVLFGLDQVLVAAKDLVNGDTIYQAPQDSICYMHLLFDQHEVIYVQDIPAESFLPSALSLSAQETETQREIQRLFPELIADPCFSLSSAKPVLRSFEGRCLQA
ncbi:MAG: Hint domain-containing protein [Sulfitobacter sp.]